MTAPPKILILAAYFGQLPSYFPLWLTSCKHNPTIHWRVVTDAAVNEELPANVQVRSMTLGQMASLISDFAGIRVALDTPYKICDAKPLFSALIEPQDRCDFWGHCDLDMLFGDLSRFVTADILENYDKIFSMGHLTLYRNNEETNTFFKRPHPDLDWRKILGRPEHFGFDEHIGVNRIWLRHRGRFYANESIVADIDPHVARFEIASNLIWHRNYRHQAFCFSDGRVRRLFWAQNKLHSEDFIYIHLQKRKLLTQPLRGLKDRFFITPYGFEVMTTEAQTPASLDRLNGTRRLGYSDAQYRARRLFRIIRNRLSSTEPAA